MRNLPSSLSPSPLDQAPDQALDRAPDQALGRGLDTDLVGNRVHHLHLLEWDTPDLRPASTLVRHRLPIEKNTPAPVPIHVRHRHLVRNRVPEGLLRNLRLVPGRHLVGNEGAALCRELS